MPATQALVLSQLEPKIAAAYITGLNDAEKKDIVLRLARLKTISPEILQTVSTSMREKFTRIRTGSATEAIDGRAVLAAILRRSDSETEQLFYRTSQKPIPNLNKISANGFLLLKMCSLQTTAFYRKNYPVWKARLLPR